MCFCDPTTPKDERGILSGVHAEKQGRQEDADIHRIEGAVNRKPGGQGRGDFSDSIGTFSKHAERLIRY